MTEPPEKKQKVEDEGQKDVEMSAAAALETVKPPEPPKELETDAAAVKASDRINERPQFLTADTTISVMQSTFGDLLMPLIDGGMQYFVSGARANVGVKSGRYVFEIKIVEKISPRDGGSCPWPRNLLRIGFSTKGSSLFVGSDESSVGFDSEGNFLCHKVKVPCSQNLLRDSVVACLLNLENGHPNCNTISLFKDGRRISQPQPLPDNLKGKTLFPTVNYRNLTLHTNFSSEMLCPLPFVCNAVQHAARKDVEVTSCPSPKDGKHDALFAVSLPDEGTFDWLDWFLEKNPHYTELSDRMILDWAEKSGPWPSKRFGSKTNNDKPEMSFGLQPLDDGLSVRRIIQAISLLQNRDFVVMEVRNNLVKEDRQAALEKFKSVGFRTSAIVLVGEPPVAFRKVSQELMLQQKQAQSDAEFKSKQEVEKRKRLHEKLLKNTERERKKKEKEEAKAKAAAEKVVAESAGNAEKKDGEEEEKQGEEKKEEEEEEQQQQEEPDPPEEEPPTVSLTDEEKRNFFRKPPIPDLSPLAMGTSFLKFSIPEKAEGFDELNFEFSPKAKAQSYLKQWIVDRKLTTRVEDIQPSEWFAKQVQAWQRVVAEWHGVQNLYKTKVAKKEAEKAAKAAKPQWKPAPKIGEEKKEEATHGEERKQGDEKDNLQPEEQTEPQEDKDVKVGFDELDIFGVDDVKDVGEGVPLFKEFQMEDWTLMGLAFELHLIAHAFKKDVNDPDRSGIYFDHLQFYYTRYFKKPLNLQMFGVTTVKELLSTGMLRDVVYITKQNLLLSALDDEMETYQVFVKLAEAGRRYRTSLIDLGDESEKLKLQIVGHPGGGAGQPNTWQLPAQGAQVAWQPPPPTKKWQSGQSNWQPHQRHQQSQQYHQQQSYGKAQGKGSKAWRPPSQRYQRP